MLSFAGKSGALVFTLLLPHAFPYDESEDAFNCPEECGVMVEEHQKKLPQCKAFDEPCPESGGRPAETRKQRNYRSMEARIVNGRDVTHPIPWYLC